METKSFRAFLLKDEIEDNERSTGCSRCKTLRVPWQQGDADGALRPTTGVPGDLLPHLGDQFSFSACAPQSAFSGDEV